MELATRKYPITQLQIVLFPAVIGAVTVGLSRLTMLETIMTIFIFITIIHETTLVLLRLPAKMSDELSVIV